MNSRIEIYVIILGLMLVDVAISTGAYFQMKTFLRDRFSIASQMDLDQLKHVAKINMLLALTLIGLIVLGIIAMGIGFFMAGFGLIDFAAVACAFSMLSWVTSRPLIKLESTIKDLPVEDDHLKSEYERVISVWNDRLFPDW